MSKYSLKIYPRAEQDLQNIISYIGDNLKNTTAAKNLLLKMQKAILRIQEYPLSCPLLVNELVPRKDIRKLIVDNYIIFYIPDEKSSEINVIRILFGMDNFIDKF